MTNFYDINKNEEVLKKQLSYAAANSPFYKKRFTDCKIDIEVIQSYEEYRKIPITTKEDLQNYNQEFIAVRKDEIIDYVTTSGTLGNPVSFALNDSDLDRLAENERQSFEMVGVRKSSVVQLTTTLDRRFMAGMAYFLGLRKLGAGIVRTGSGLPGLQWESIERFQPDILVAVPSFLLKMIDFARQNGIDYKSSSIKVAVCIGEPLRNPDFSLNSLGQKIKELWDIELFSTYASTEMGTAFTECEFHKGNHSLPDLIFPEVLDENQNPVEPGEIGELVVTPLQTQTMPLVRFATGDMVKFYGENCDCGRKSIRISTPVGRKKQMIKLRGTTLYPQQIINLLTAFQSLKIFVIEASLNENQTDEILIRIPNDFAETSKLQEHLQAGLKVKVSLEKTSVEKIEKMKFPQESRKPKLFHDFR
ncbi:phenylacetate--CoA ligase family protein [Salegentibacter salarius]|uniref:Phenylacetate--CoA ligase n=1 Tax=Salegentibacter salarius TaxID=435906 RepID=A0A2N0TTS1_9FLAO|nr:AMP-binding protein [Salegentibacter salarius]OEY72433.1 phenylacetate--CoA ligase [Salegentibacter salarius]PKD18139.1 phenylacetate--CoA ligase [Salegentibacter salarius]SLK03245.1 phenylacetate-CoA ligase [Salegentibacter salarius]